MCDRLISANAFCSQSDAGEVGVHLSVTLCRCKPPFTIVRESSSPMGTCIICTECATGFSGFDGLFCFWILI